MAVLEVEKTAEKAAAGITVTPKAVEKIRQTFVKMGVADQKNAGLRLGVLGGGCTGLSYQFKFDTKPRPTDNVFDYDGVQIFKVDPKEHSVFARHGSRLQRIADAVGLRIR